MFPQVIEKYLPYVQQLSRRLDTDPGALQELFHTIEDHKDNAIGDEALQEFFKGEYAFYNGLYERSLNHYLKARSVKHFEFFCYRASAYVFKEKGDLKQALKFVKKALVIFPEDYVSQLLFRDLLAPIEPVKGLQDIEEKDFGSQDKFLEDFSDVISSPHSDLNPQESNMNTDTNLFSYASTADPTVKAMLTERLYPSTVVEQYIAPFSQPEARLELPFDEFTLFDEKGPGYATDYVSNKFTSHQLDKQNDELDSAYRSFQSIRSSVISQYLDFWKKRSALPDDCLYVFFGWHHIHQNRSVSTNDPASIINILLSDRLNKSSGGYFLRWNGKGIVINPGKSFLLQFHKKGLHVRDIDFIICTHEQPDSYSDISEIYELNACLNRTDGGMHIIRYYLNQGAYNDLTTLFKTTTKIERRAIHCLELFLDSSDSEKVELEKGIQLVYFSAAHSTVSSSYSHLSKNSPLYPSSLGIRLELSTPSAKASSIEENPKTQISIGYISGKAWSPLVSHQLTKCDILLAGIGNTNTQDYNKISHMEDCLGYFGISSLFEDTQPKLLLCTEFSGNDGDLRLEIAKSLRAEYSVSTSNCNPTILPADSELFVDLETLSVRCTQTGKLVNASQIRVLKPSGAFGPLQYLSSSCLL